MPTIHLIYFDINRSFAILYLKVPARCQDERLVRFPVCYTATLLAQTTVFDTTCQLNLLSDNW